MFQTAVAGYAQTAVFIIIYPDTVIILGILSGNFCTSILASVINNNNFQIIIALVNDRIQALANMFFNSVYRNNNRNQLFLTHISSSSQVIPVADGNRDPAHKALQRL